MKYLKALLTLTLSHELQFIGSRIPRTFQRFKANGRNDHVTMFILHLLLPVFSKTEKFCVSIKGQNYFALFSAMHLFFQEILYANLTFAGNGIPYTPKLSPFPFTYRVLPKSHAFVSQKMACVAGGFVHVGSNVLAAPPPEQAAKPREEPPLPHHSHLGFYRPY